MGVTSREWMLTLHVLPLECGTVLGLLMFYIFPGHIVLPLMFLFVGTLGTLLLLTILPLSPLKSAGMHHVGIRHITQELAVYYPTFIKPIEGEPWLPGNNSHYIHTMAAKANVRSMWLNHLKLVRIPCTRNASIVSLMTHHRGPRHVFIFSHTLSTHHLAYSRIALALAASGAVVYSVLHADSIAVSVGGGGGRENNIASHVVDEEIELNTQRNTQERLLTCLENRIEDIVRVIHGISNGELLRQLQVKSEELQTFLSAGVKINLIGHGFGGLTMLAVAARNMSVAPFIHTVTGFDVWPLHLLDSVTERSLSLPPHIKLQFIDSEEWCGRSEHTLRVQELKGQLAFAGASCVSMTCRGTDHLSVMDMGLFSPLTKRKRFATLKSGKYIPQMAKELIQFAEE